VIRGSPTAINIARVWIIVAVVCKLRARVARSEVRAIIFVRDRIMVAAGFKLRARVTRSESRANNFFWGFYTSSGGGARCERES
jgi:hypothetical protein